MKPSFFLALLLTTGVLRTAVVAQEGGDFDPLLCRPLVPPDLAGAAVDPPPVKDAAQCPGLPGQCIHCIVDIDGSPVDGHAPEQILKDALQRCNTTVRLGPTVDLNYAADEFKGLRPLKFNRCVTLTSVNDFNSPTSEARTPRSSGPILRYGDIESWSSFFSVACDERNKDEPFGDHVRISGFRLFGKDQSLEEPAGIRVTRCVDVEISNMEIWGFGQGIHVKNLDADPPPRITDYSQVRIHDNYIHHNQIPSIAGHAGGYGVQTHSGGRAHIYRNVFDFNRHAIESGPNKGTGYFAQENLVLKGGGWHGGTFGTYTHIFDVHGDGCWWNDNLCGDAGDEYHYYRNSFQYLMDNAISIRGKPRTGVYINENVFPHKYMLLCCGLAAWLLDGVITDQAAVLLNSSQNVDADEQKNILNTDTFGEYYSQCDFDGDGIDDLFLATGTTWWFSSSAQFHWTFLNTSSKRTKELRFGYFDDDDRCDVVTESGPGRWLISSGGTAPWKPFEQVWLPEPMGGLWKPLKDVQFGRFDPNDQSHSRRTTHAFWRNDNGERRIKILSDPTSDWEYIGGSPYALKDLLFGDFTGDGVTDVLAVDNGHWAISESARKKWQPHNPFVKDPVRGLFVANMDSDDSKDDVLQLEIRPKPGVGDKDVEVIWWRSKNGTDNWTEFKRYTFKYPSNQPDGIGYVYPHLGFVGRFGPQAAGTLVIDEKRRGRFFSLGSWNVEWVSLYPY